MRNLDGPLEPPDEVGCLFCDEPGECARRECWEETA